MGLGIVLVGVVQVVGGNPRDVQFLGQAQQVLGDAALDVQPVVHEFAEVVFLAEQVLEFRGGGLGLVVLAQAQLGLDLAGGAPRRGDDALVVGVEQVAVQPRVLAEHRVEGGDGGGLEEVLHAGVVVAQQRHVRVEATAGDVVALLAFVGAPLDTGLVVACGTRGHIGLDADDRLDAGLGCLVPEVEGTEEITVVGGGQSGHPQPVGLLKEFGQACSTVKH